MSQDVPQMPVVPAASVSPAMHVAAILPAPTRSRLHALPLYILESWTKLNAVHYKCWVTAPNGLKTTASVELAACLNQLVILK